MGWMTMKAIKHGFSICAFFMICILNSFSGHSLSGEQKKLNKIFPPNCTPFHAHESACVRVYVVCVCVCVCVRWGPLTHFLAWFGFGLPFYAQKQNFVGVCSHHHSSLGFGHETLTLINQGKKVYPCLLAKYSFEQVPV